MALNKGQNAGTIYLSVANGKLVRQHKEPNENTVSRVNKQGRTVHEEFFKDLTGVITGISLSEDKGYGRQWQVQIEDDGERYLVQMQYSGRYSASFLKALPNLKHGEEIRFMPWEMQDKNNAAKTITGVTIYQFDGNGFVKISPAFTKDNPNGIPQLEKIKVKGVETWDDTEMMEFLENVATEWCKGLNAGWKPVEGDVELTDEAPF